MTELDKSYRPSTYKNIIYFEKEVSQFLDNMSQLKEISEDEFEIFRITTYSAGHPDIVSLRAKYEDSVITYKIIDNFESKSLELSLSTLPIKSSLKPLSYGEIINIINNTNYEDDEDGLYLSTCKFLLEEGDDIDEVKKFVNIDSIYYPGLKRFFSEQISLI
jgi:hypothetical protein